MAYNLRKFSEFSKNLKIRFFGFDLFEFCLNSFDFREIWPRA